MTMSIRTTRTALALGATLWLAGCAPPDTPPPEAIEPATPASRGALEAAEVAQAGKTASAASPAAAPGAPPPGTKPFDFDASGCGFPAVVSDPSVRILAAGAHAGAPAGFEIDESGHQATLMRVAVNRPGERVALLLGAYEPTVWSVGWTAGTEIVAVLATGYHDQRLSGLPAGTPTGVSTYQNRGACGFAYVETRPTGGLDGVAGRAFGRGVDEMHIAQGGRAMIGPAGDALITGADAPEPAEFAVAGTLPAGDAGLQVALRDGLLRRATPADAEAWRTAARDAGALYGEQAHERATHPMLNDRSYTVLKSFRFPSGLYGAHLAVFYLPQGVAEPTGNPGHSSVFDIATGTCRGPMCRAE